ncbi:MAG: protein kinase [Planctomycetota bacterium]
MATEHHDDNDHEDRVCAAFLELLEVDAEARGRAISRLEEGLREPVAQMLQDFEQPAPILRQVQASDRPRPVPKIPGYVIGDKIGEGGMGQVYRATQERPRREVAIKMLSLDSALGDDGKRFEREIEALGLLQHRGICRIYNAGRAQADHDGRGMPWFAMELFDGLPLVEYANARGLGWRERCELVVQICRAVEHAHERGVVHRDLKPANILVVDGEEGAAVVKVLDFGIARLQGGDAAAAYQTQTGYVIGTLNYMSPEQFAGTWASVDGRADVYAIGVLLFELLTGDLPLDVAGRPLAEVMRLLSDTDPKRPTRLRPELPRDVDKVVRKALSKQPEDRYGSAAEFGSDLQRMLTDQPVTAQPATLLYQLRKFARRNRVLVAGVVATMLALALGLVISLTLLGQNQLLAKDREASRLDAVQAGQRLRAALYAAEMRLCGQSMRWPAGASLQRELIQRWQPASPDPTSLTADAPRDLRDFEWYLAWASCHREELVARCPTNWHGMWWMPSQDAIYSAGGIWSAEDGQRLASLGDRVCQSDRGGALVLDSLGDRGYGIRRVGAAQPHASFEIPQGLYRSAFSPDGTLLACFLQKFGGVRIYDAKTAEVVAEMLSRGSGCYEVAWSDDSQQLAMTYPKQGQHVGVWRRGQWDQPYRGLKGDIGHASGLCFDRSGGRVACSGNKGELIVWDLEDGSVLLDREHTEGLLDVAFHPSGNRVACGCFNGAVYIHEIDGKVGGGVYVDVRRGHKERVEGVAYDATGERLAAVAGGYLRIWRTDSTPVRRELEPRKIRGVFEQLTWSPDGSAVSSRLRRETYHLDEPADAEQPSSGAGRAGSARASLGRVDPFESRWLPEGLLCITGSSYTLRPHTGEPESWRHGPANLMQVLPGRQIEATAGKGGLFVFDYSDGGRKTPRRTDVKGATQWFLWTSDAQRVARLDFNGYVDLLDAESFDRQRRVKLETRITSFDIDPVTGLFVFGCSDHTIRLWSEQQGELAVITGHLGVVGSVAFRVGGTRIASGATDGTVRIWDVKGAAEVMSFEMSSSVFCVAWSPNGHRLAALDGSGRLAVWDATTAYLQETVRQQSSK